MKTYMPLNGLRWSRNSGSANCDMPQSAVFGRPGGGIFGNKENYMVEWGDADDDGYPDTEEGHNEYEKDCQSGKQPWKGHKIFHDRYRSSIVEAYLSANNQ